MPKGVYNRSKISFAKRVKRIKKKCIRCKKEFEVLPCHSHKQYCNRKCFNDSKAFGHYKKHTDESKLRMSKSIKKGYNSWRIHHYKDKNRSLETREKISNTLAGSNPWNKDLGYSKLLYLIINSVEYKEWRTTVFQRDNYTCQECNKKGIYIEAHHIISKREIIEQNNIITFKDALKCKQLWDINNGLTLCKKCHYKTDNYGYKGINKNLYSKHN